MKTKSVLTAICGAIAVALIVQACGPRQPETKPITVDDIKPIIEQAYKEYLKESKNAAISTIIERAKVLAENELKRLNESEIIYNKDTVRTIILPGPLTYGWHLKQYRDYHTATPADIVDDTSLLISCNIYIKYDYRVNETKRHHNTLEEDGLINAELETEYHPTEGTGYVVLSYGFDNALEYNGMPPAVVASHDAGDELGSSMQALGAGVKFEAHWTPWTAVNSY
jgi:hypothetical protein